MQKLVYILTIVACTFFPHVYSNETINEEQPSEQYQFYKCPWMCECDILKELADCSGRELSQLPENISDTVQILDLSYNQFTDIPANITALTNLRVLNLRNNKIGAVSRHSLENLKNLHTLDLSENAFTDYTDISSDFLMPAISLASWVMDNNNLNQIPQVNSKSLRELYLTNCSIDHIRKNISHFYPSLEKLILDYNNIKTVKPFDAESLTTLSIANSNVAIVTAHVFEKLNRLIYVNLSGNLQLSSLSVKSEFLEKLIASRCNLKSIPTANLTNLTYIDLSYNQITVLNANAFENMTRLKYINLFHNNIENVDQRAFVDLVEVNAIDLSHNSIVSVDPQTFKLNERLQTLNLSQNYLQHFIQFDIKHLRQLDLSECEISSLDIQSLALMPQLQRLILARNVFTTVPSNLTGTQVQYLDLSYGRLLNLKADSFNRMKNLRYVNIKGNRLVELKKKLLYTVQEMYVSDNPWRCDCDSREFYEIYVRLGSIQSDVYSTTCLTPEKYEGLYWHVACSSYWANTEENVNRAWMYALGIITGFCLIACMVTSITNRMRKREIQRAEDERIESQRETRRQMEEAALMTVETITYNAPDPKNDEESPPSYTEALSMERLAASYDSLNFAPEPLGSTRSLNNAGRRTPKRRRRRRRSRSSAASADNLADGSESAGQTVVSDSERRSEVQQPPARPIESDV